ncbi:MAG: hypothetical protein KJP10_02860 [Gammaproteobacteria bacterium]|nr:hypothetical protein [Gammaproteobacteria bacterium]
MAKTGADAPTSVSGGDWPNIPGWLPAWTNTRPGLTNHAEQKTLHSFSSQHETASQTRDQACDHSVVLLASTNKRVGCMGEMRAGL